MFIASVRLFEFQFVDMHNAYGPADMEIICRVLPIKRGIKEIPIEYRKRLGVSKVHPMVLLVAMWVVVKTRLGFERKRRAGHQKHNS